MSTEVIKTLEFYIERNNQTLNTILARHDIAAEPSFLRLLESIRYSLVSQLAKRLRPILVYAIGEAMHAPLPFLDAPAAAIELLHTASLVHDDLPALDNDDIRRGQASCHKAFDEATAILAGNTMQMLAFEILTETESQLTLTQQVKSIHLLTKAYGIGGVMTGQMLDLYELQSKSRKTIDTTYRLKTASLIKAALFLGAITADCHDQHVFDTLTQFAENIGLAYQIQDDILDIETDQKTTNEISTTYPSIVGIEKAKDKVKSLYEHALASLRTLPCDIKLLEAITKRMIFRTY
jgi:geranylgeranyl pyrophosphate synthase